MIPSKVSQDLQLEPKEITVQLVKAKSVPSALRVIGTVVDFSHSLLSISSMAGLLLNNTIISPGLLVPINWFNKV